MYSQVSVDVHGLGLAMRRIKWGLYVRRVGRSLWYAEQTMTSLEFECAV